MAEYKPAPIIEELKSPPSSETLFKNIKNARNSFFLDSSTGHSKLGRYSFLGCEPFLVFKSKRDAITLEWHDGRKETIQSDPFSALKQMVGKYPIENKAKELPLTSGAVGYFAYDLKDFVEELPDIARDDLGLPDCIVGFYDVVAIYDNIGEKAYIASSGYPETEPVKNRKRALGRLEEFKDKILSDHGREDPHRDFHPARLKSNFSKASYIRAIENIKRYIKMGDIYQANLSQRYESQLNMAPYELYSRLRRFSPAPFSAYLGFGDVMILSSSPERFLLKRGDYIETRPIKGTRPRGRDEFSDMLLESELLNSQKDRAEHIMIVDLERNDLGRICEYGSVRPSEYIVLEKYSTVFHLVSTVSGKLKRGIGPVDCLLATFPGGSITGAPKIRAMEIIEELEPVKRSVYTGAIGYISFDGNMDTSIAIRTFVIKDNRIYFQVGGGIVADSNPEEEYEETIIKARAMMQSLGIELRNMEPALI